MADTMLLANRMSEEVRAISLAPGPFNANFSESQGATCSYTCARTAMPVLTVSPPDI